MVLSEVMFDMLEREIPFWYCHFSSTHEVAPFECFAYGCQAVMCHSFINECALHPAGQVPQNCITGQTGKKGYFNLSGSLLLKICWGVSCAQQRPSFLLKNKIPGTTSAIICRCIEADSLQPACRQPNWNSHHRSEHPFTGKCFLDGTHVATCI